MVDDIELARLQQAVQGDPKDAGTRLALLQLLVEAERWKEAEEAGDVLLQDESPVAAAHALMGIVYSKDRRWDAAVGQCRQALEKQPDDPLVLFNLGTLLVQQGDPQAAIEHLEKAIELQSGWAEAHYALGTALLHRERYREAINAFDEALELRPAYPEAEFNRGNAYAMRGLESNGTLDYYELDCAVAGLQEGHPAAARLPGGALQPGHGLQAHEILGGSARLGRVHGGRPSPARGDDLVGAGAGVQGRSAGPTTIIGLRGRRTLAHGPEPFCRTARHAAQIHTCRRWRNGGPGDSRGGRFVRRAARGPLGGHRSEPHLASRLGGLDPARR